MTFDRDKYKSKSSLTRNIEVINKENPSTRNEVEKSPKDRLEDIRKRFKKPEKIKKTAKKKEGCFIEEKKLRTMKPPTEEELLSLTIEEDVMKELKTGLTEKPPEQLFGELWYEGDTCILFGTTDTGKSILAWQIAAILSSGIDIGFGFFKGKRKQRKVLLYDFEENRRLLAERYSNDAEELFEFDGNYFKRVTVDENVILKGSYTDNLLHSVKLRVEKGRPEILIIDNITYINDDTMNPVEVLKFLRKINSLNKKFNLSILMLSHTPKRKKSEQITVNDLSGSSNYSNFIRSMFAIGSSTKGENTRYIKQIKGKHGKKVYGEDNVIEVEIKNIYDNFVGYEIVDENSESNHLFIESKKKGRKGLSDIVKFEIYRKYQLKTLEGTNLHTQRSIGEEYEITEARVGQIIKEIKNNSELKAKYSDFIEKN